MAEKWWIVGAFAAVATAAGGGFVACSGSSSDGPGTTDAGAETQDDTFLPPTDTPEDTSPAETSDDTADAAPDPLAGCIRDPGAPAPDSGVPIDGGFASDASTNPIDPSTFTVDMAMAGFPPIGVSDAAVDADADAAAPLPKITALITTELGQIVCQLDTVNAPITSANFIGLARGTRPAQRASTIWTWSHFYDGLKWHRVIPKFVIQGGDPLGNGTGGPGYDLPVENHVAEPKGTIAMAATGPTSPSGSQYYIVVGTGPASDYNVFGKCTTDVAIAISNVPRNAADVPKTPVHMQSIEIAVCP